MSTNGTTKEKERLTGFDIVVGLVVVFVFGVLLGAVIGLIKSAVENEGAIASCATEFPSDYAKVGGTSACYLGTSEGSAYFVAFNPTTLQKGDKAQIEYRVGGRTTVQTGTVVNRVQVPSAVEGETDDIAIIKAPYFFDDAVFNIHSNDSIRREATP